MCIGCMGSYECMIVNYDLTCKKHVLLFYEVVSQHSFAVRKSTEILAWKIHVFEPCPLANVRRKHYISKIGAGASLSHWTSD
jgi:hypothetical protein